MGIFLLKNVAKKSLLNSRYVFRNSSFNPKRHVHLFDNTKKLPLVKRLYGNNNNLGGDKMNYFSLLSTNLSPEKQLRLPFSKINVVGSCNGLVCLEDVETKESAVLWNPSSNEVKVLPHTCIQRDPCASDISFSCCGFGFDRNSQDYKVIRFIDIVFETDEGHYHHTETHAELYSLKSDSWEDISNNLPDLLPHSAATAYVDGVFYWVATGDTEKEILSYDFANHKLSSFGFPESGKPRGPYTVRLLEWDGLLTAIIYPIFGKTEKLFNLWAMNDESWGRVSVFPVPRAVRPLGFWTKDELLFEGIDHDLKLFDLATREAKHLHIYDYPGTLEFIPCVESRVRLNVKPEFENKEQQPSKEAFH